MERSKGTFYTSGVSTSMQITYTGWNRKFVQTVGTDEKQEEAPENKE